MTRGWLYDCALTLHLIGAFALVSGVVLAGVGLQFARRRARCAEIALLLGLARGGALLAVAGTVLTAGFGLWLVSLGNWGYATPWITAAVGLLTAVLALGALGGQRPKKARQLADRLHAEQLPPSPQLRALLEDRGANALNYLAAAGLVVIIVLMVVKPGSTAA